MQILKLWASIFKNKTALWELPNNLLGVFFASFYLIFCNAKLYSSKPVQLIRFQSNTNFGICLGRVILLAGSFNSVDFSHELGHLRQSILLGPFYLFFIGLPSLLRATYFYVFNVKPQQNYYYFYTEAWADYLGGIYHLRKHRLPHWKGYLKFTHQDKFV